MEFCGSCSWGSTAFFLERAQRLSASWSFAEHAYNLTDAAILCSTPFGIMEFCGTLAVKLPWFKGVLNAFRHHGVLRIRARFRRVKKNLRCSTSFGIMEFCGRALPHRAPVLCWCLTLFDIRGFCGGPG